MKALREQDFDDMAGRVVSRFMNGDKLADVAAMEAQQAQLNPDQIERLVQAANTMAFLQLMEHQKAQGIPDMTGEFDPIDSRQVIQHILGSVPAMGGAGHAEPDGDEMPLPDEMHPARCVDAPGSGGPEMHDSMCVDADEPSIPEGDDDDGPFPKGQKQKAKNDSDKEKGDKKPAKKAPPKDAEGGAKEAAFRTDRLRKLAEILEDQYRQAELAFDDEFEKLSTLLKRASGAPTADAFEKDALALHNDAVGVAILNMVQEKRGWAVATGDYVGEKVAELTDRHLVDDNEVNKVFANLVKIAREAGRLHEGIEHVRSQCN